MFSKEAIEFVGESGWVYRFRQITEMTHTTKATEIAPPTASMTPSKALSIAGLWLNDAPPASVQWLVRVNALFIIDDKSP